MSTQRPAAPSAPFADDPDRIRNPNLPLKLLHARERVLRQFRPVFNEFALTEQQWRVIRALLEAGPLEQHAVGELCGFASASLVGILARMEAQGWVERTRVAADQRRVVVRLTAASRSLAARMRPRVASTYEQIERRIGRDRLSLLATLLDEVIGSLDDDAPPAPSAPTDKRTA